MLYQDTTDYEVHEPEFSETTTEDWEAPQQEDFVTDDLSEIAGHFVLSGSRLPAGELHRPQAASGRP